MMTPVPLPPIPWDCYGWHARISYVRSAIEAAQERSASAEFVVLDVGCGTGDLLTVPLAIDMPGVRFIGVDTHDDTIMRSQERYPSVENLEFRCLDIFEEAFSVDVIICSEVLEHIPAYEQFLDRLVDFLLPDGILIVTVPNGRGPAELQRRIWVRLFERTGILDRVRRWRPRAADDPDRSCCFLTDDSPHVNFFKASELKSLADRRGLDMSPIEGRCFLSGPFLAPFLRGRRLSEWNERLARRLPTWMVSSWMFSLQSLHVASRSRDYLETDSGR